jgi:hypothetical protein
MNEPTEKSLAELLREDDADDDEQCLCTHCGYSQPSEFRTCPKCGKWVGWPTLAEWGKQLPIGVQEGDRFLKDFDLVPLDWKLDREIGRSWSKRREQLTLSDYVGTILAHTVTDIGGQDITKFKLPKRLLIFNQMYQADVFYVYAYLRLISMGNEMKISSVQCPSCSHRFEYIADLSTLEVVTIDNPADMIKEIKLRDGFEMAGEQRFTLKVKPPKWNMLGSAFPTTLNEADMFAAMLMNATHEIEGMPDGAALTEQQVSQFSKYDVEVCHEALDEVIAGPRWEVEGECPKCEEPFFEVIDWTYDRFFAHSSRSPRRGRRSRR